MSCIGRGKDRWRVVSRPIPEVKEEFMQMPGDQIRDMLSYLGDLDMAQQGYHLPPFNEVYHSKSKQLCISLKGLSMEELETHTKALIEGRLICFECRETLSIPKSSMISEKIFYDIANFPLLGGPLSVSEEKVFIKFFKKLDFDHRGQVSGADLREWIQKTSFSVSECLFIDFLFTLIPTVKTGFARFEEMVQNIEIFTAMDESELQIFAFRVLCQLSDKDNPVHILVDKLAKKTKYFSILSKTEGKAFAKDNASINDLLLKELGTYSKEGSLNCEEFLEICRRSPLTIFPLKWIQTAFFSFKGLGSSLQARRAEAMHVRSLNKSSLSTFRSARAVPIIEPDGASEKIEEPGPRLWPKKRMKSRSGKLVPESHSSRDYKYDATPAALRKEVRTSLRIQRKEARRIQFDMDSKNSKRLSMSHFSRDSFFSAPQGVGGRLSILRSSLINSTSRNS